MASLGFRLVFILMLGATGVSSLVITNPTVIVSGSPTTWTWTVDANDPPLFSIVLVNSSAAQSYSGGTERTMVADDVDATRLQVTVSGVQRKTWVPHVAYFVNNSDSSHIFATRVVEVGDESGESQSSASGEPQSSTTFASSSMTTPPSATPSFSIQSPSSSTASPPSTSSGPQMHSTTHGRGRKLPKSTIVAITFGAVTLCLLTVGITFFLYPRVQRRLRDRDREQDQERLDVEASGRAGSLDLSEVVEIKSEGPMPVAMQDSPAGSGPYRQLEEQVVEQLRAMQRQMEELQGAVGLGAEQNEALRERIRVLEAELDTHGGEGGNPRPPSYVSK